MGKGEIAHNEQFLLFPQCFLLNQIIVSVYPMFNTISLFAAELEEPKIGISDKGFSKMFYLFMCSLCSYIYEKHRGCVSVCDFVSYAKFV